MMVQCVIRVTAQWTELKMTVLFAMLRAQRSATHLELIGSVLQLRFSYLICFVDVESPLVIISLYLIFDIFLKNIYFYKCENSQK